MGSQRELEVVKRLKIKTMGVAPTVITWLLILAAVIVAVSHGFNTVRINVSSEV